MRSAQLCYINLRAYFKKNLQEILIGRCRVYQLFTGARTLSQSRTRSRSSIDFSLDLGLTVLADGLSVYVQG